MPEMIPFDCPQFSCRQTFTSDSWCLKHIKLNNPEHLQVAHQQNLTVLSAPQRVEPSQHLEFNTLKDSVEDLDAFSYLERVKHITDLQSQPLLSPLLRTETYTGAVASLGDYIVEACEHEAHVFL
jgi:hypothetical protein